MSEQQSSTQVGIIVVAHADYGSAMLRTAEFILGTLSDCTSISVDIAQEVPETPAEEVTETPEAPAVERSVKIGLVSGSTIYDGDHVGLRAELIGYEDVAYAIQWQVWNAETQSWDDIAGAVTDTLWLDVTESMNGYQYQVLVTIL